MTGPATSVTVRVAFQRRGYDDGFYGRDTAAGKTRAEEISQEALTAYLDGVRVGRRERGRRST